VAYTIWHAEPHVDFAYDVLYEDEHILAVAKSGNLPVHACGVFITHTLIAKIKEDYGPNMNLGHRLDRETSGVIVLAKHKEANREMAGLFARREVQKDYTAIVFGEVEPDELMIDAPIGKIDVRYQYSVEYEYGKENDLATYLPKRRVDFENGKPSRTRCEVVERGEGMTRLRVIPEHGRTNQIRVHLQHAGHPLLGDKIYALTGEPRDELLRKGVTERVADALVMDRHALHCERLRFSHPITSVPLDLYAPIPDDITAAWKPKL
jgi:23S rRNA pseudouridine1911/1915/1917 synthase